MFETNKQRKNKLQNWELRANVASNARKRRGKKPLERYYAYVLISNVKKEVRNAGEENVVGKERRKRIVNIIRWKQELEDPSRRTRKKEQRMHWYLKVFQEWQSSGPLSEANVILELVTLWLPHSYLYHGTWRNLMVKNYIWQHIILESFLEWHMTLYFF